MMTDSADPAADPAPETGRDPDSALRARLVAAATPHVAFDGWSDALLPIVAAQEDVRLSEVRRLFPRGAVDIAAASHRMGDAEMTRRIAEADMTGMRFRDRVARALEIRLEAIEDKEAARRATALFALPHLAPEGARLIWGTADAVWTALGDTSRDANWYSKRATLSAVWASVVLFWLGDDSWEGQATRDFISRRIDDVMRIEQVKGKVRSIPVIGGLAGMAERAMSGLRAPGRGMRPEDLPGRWSAR
ncbi:COQ9 family protein [Wenxinia saemankumensis]|uniref:Ubiquinone biosynthesis protein COQ9 n=1 Tax=Wenxinia saemankumensis TaxID=1447782 RepID=A0A1M6EDQ4_9RHOB|nr:COQ9 family protein [Wenxinia saemankumensis]SHI83612.1 ubiquinone biosynthesis protein COQ9 [Wenxinia saemankumensis]